jgi:hypothetical protein
MRPFEHDWLQLGSRVARSFHYQHSTNLRLTQAAQADMEVMAEQLAEAALDDDAKTRHSSSECQHEPGMRRGGTQVACWRSVPSSKATIEHR